MIQPELKNLKVASELHREVKAYAAKNDEGLQEFTERAIRAAIGTPAPPAENGDSLFGGLTSSNQKLLREIAEVLRREKEVKEFAQFARTARAYLDLFRPLGLLPDRE